MVATGAREVRDLRSSEDEDETALYGVHGESDYHDGTEDSFIDDVSSQLDTSIDLVRARAA